MYVTINELSTNVEKYLDLVEKEDVIIVEHGIPIARMTGDKNIIMKAFEEEIGRSLRFFLTLEMSFDQW